jgi:hypothetical protein
MEVTEHKKRDSIRTQDYSGTKMWNWDILEKIKHPGYIYKIRCQCGKEFERNIMGIINSRSSCCKICIKKRNLFKYL